MGHGYSIYPQYIDGFTYKQNITDDVIAKDINELQDGIESVQITLGTNPQGSKATVAERLDQSMDSSGNITTASTTSDYFQIDSDGTSSTPYLSFSGSYDKRLTWNNNTSRFEFGTNCYIGGSLVLASTLSGISTLTATTGNITTVSATTVGATTGNITTVSATTVGATTGNITTVNATTGNITTVASTTIGATTGNITTVSATTVGATTGNITTVNATTVNATNGQGIFPIGGVVAVFTAIAGSSSPSVANGWALCNGTTPASQGVSSPAISATMPNINNGAFVRGATSSWTTGGASGGADSVTIGSANLPTHTHDIAHGHANSFAVSAVALGGTTSFASTGHTHTMSSHTHTGPSHTHSGVTGTESATHTHGAGTGTSSLITQFRTTADTFLSWKEVSADAWTYNYQVGINPRAGGSALVSTGIQVQGNTTTESATHTHSIGADGTGATGTNNGATAGPSATASISVSGGVLSGAVTSLGTTASGNGGFANTATATLPVYFSACYYMRVK